MEKDCIFCKIIRGEVPSEKIHENEKFIAFADANPVGEGHTLVIPKKHFDTLEDLEEEYSEDYLMFVNEVAEILIKRYGAEGFNMALNNGKVAGQVIRHVHFHILPRKERDGKRGIYLG